MSRLLKAIVLISTIAGILACSNSALSPAATPDLAETATPDHPEDTARRFLQALSERRYHDMWIMLTPEAQSPWSTAASFADYLDKKFGAFSISFSLGEKRSLPEWIDPDNGYTWLDVVELPVSLRLDGQALSAFNATSVIVAGQRLLGPGPVARSAPLLLPSILPTNTSAVPILAYHHVAQQEPTDFEQITMTVTTSQFEEELAHLKDAGYQTISLRHLYEGMYYGVQLPSKPVILTFDDGYADAYTEAFPLLQKYGFNGTFAVFTNAIGVPGFLSEGQIQTMAAAGMEFVSHTVNHIDLGAASPEQAAVELRDSRATLERILGKPMQFLVYPFGEPFAHYGPETQAAVIELLRQEGYVAAVTNPLPNAPPDITQRAEAPYQLVRVNVPGRLPLVRFIARLEGSDPSLSH